MMPKDREMRLARKARLAGGVMALTMLAWMAAQWLGGWLGLEARYVFLVDFAALAALFWALVVTYQIWRARRDA
jgi:hypothetical protein